MNNTEKCMLWFEDEKGAAPIQAVKNAGRYFYKKYGQIPKHAAIPEDWGYAANAIEKELEGIEVEIDKMLLPRHVTVSA